MDIEIDYNPSPSKHFFISVGLNKKEAISFDYTSKGHRVIKQVLIDKRPFPKNKKPTSEWDALVIKNGKFQKRYHVKWLDAGSIDQVNNETWETVWRKPISKAAKDKLLKYSQFFSDNYKRLDLLKKEWLEFENFVKNEIAKLTHLPQ